jgi:putative transcriptional regulator
MHTRRLAIDKRAYRILEGTMKDREPTADLIERTKVKKSKSSGLTKVLLETADDMHRVGVMDDVTQRKITLRHLGDKAPRKDAPLTPKDIRELRERAHLSQAVFARYLKLTAGYVSQLERGAKKTTGPALVLLNVIRRKGIEIIL